MKEELLSQLAQVRAELKLERDFVTPYVDNIDRMDERIVDVMIKLENNL